MKQLRWMLFLILGTCAYAQKSGTTDLGFGKDGSISFGVSANTFEIIRTVKVLPDGRYLAAGTGGTSNSNKFYIAFIDSSKSDVSPILFTLPTFAGNQINEIRAVTITSENFIIAAGFTAISSTAPKVMVAFRLRMDGSFYNMVYQTNGLESVFAKDIFYNPIDRTCLILASYGTGIAYNTRLYKVQEDAGLQAQFGTNQGYYENDYVEASKFTINSDGSIFICGQTQGNFAFDDIAIIKLRSNGFPDSGFLGGMRTISLTNGGNEKTTCIMLDKDNNLVFGGYVVNGSMISPLLGWLDAGTGSTLSFSGAGYTVFDYIGQVSYLSSISLDVDGSIYAAGTTTGLDGFHPLVFQVSPSGILDISFGNQGFYSDTTKAFIYSADVDFGQGKLVLGGIQNGGQNYFMSRMYLSQPVTFDIVGKDFVTISSQNSYSVYPQSDGFYYEWEYDSDSVYVLGKSNKSSFTLFFPAFAPSANLTCNIYDSRGLLIQSLSKYIRVKQYYSLSDELAETQCEFYQTDSENSFINSVYIENGPTFSELSGYNPSGYQDYTALEDYDTLFLGDRFTMKLHCPSSASRYGAAWIDSNNDGKITSDEFGGLGEKAGSDSVLYIRNVSVPIRGKVGPARLRVRVSNNPLTSDMACASEYDRSETEDYLVLLLNSDNTLAPNFITPNNDGQNDYFVIRGIDKKASSNKLQIFDRLGNLIYEREDYDNSWQGETLDNERAAAGTYYFIFTQQYTSSSRQFGDVSKGFLEIRY
ncbi:MAG: gliding motility-associated C-terminal domain-containing protein [Cytophagaceae bacterium]|nr:gliding motility-associated C-terminal domain-containing protein [Cytophagaceae bacterium]